MADEDEVRELIGRMSAAQRQGFHVTPGMMAVVLTALRFYLSARTWLAKPRADPHDDASRRKPEPYTGPPATIADLKARGLAALTVQCDGPNCWNEKRITFEALSLDEGTPFPDIPKWRGFRCQRCGSRQVRVSPDWTDHKAGGNGKLA